MRQRKRKYEDRESFETWLLAGTLEQAVKVLNENHPGMKATISGVGFSAKRWIVWNLVEARALMKGREIRVAYFDSTWDEYTVRCACLVFLQSNGVKYYREFLKEHNLEELAQKLNVYNQPSANS